MDFIQEIDNIIHTLELITIQATKDNLDHMLGAVQHLEKMRDIMAAIRAAEARMAEAKQAEAQPAEEVAGDA